MIQLITEDKKIKTAQRQFSEKLLSKLPEEILCTVGYPGGSISSAGVRYAPDLNVWFYADYYAADNRFWNAFGTGQPKTNASNSITVEINFPISGRNARVAGAFARDENGQILVLHSGKIGGGKAGNGKGHFLEHFRGDMVTAFDGEKETQFCLVGGLQSDQFTNQVADFIMEVARIKRLVQSGQPDLFQNFADFAYTDEHSGVVVSERQNPTQINRTHGIVVNALARELESMGKQVGNDRNRDLFIHSEGRITTLFEVKTSTSTQNLSTAIGQLLLYSIPIATPVRLVAVLPDRLSPAVQERFGELGIQVLYYEWQDQVPEFRGLGPIISGK